MTETPPRKKVLIVEDDPDLLAVLEQSLSAAYAVVTVRYGSAAFEEILKRRPHLVLMDVHVPQANGMEICARIRAHRELKTLPVLFLTGQTDQWTREKARQSGASGYLTKPIEPQALLAAIRDFIGL